MKTNAKRAVFIASDIAAAVLIILSAILGIFTTEGRLWMSGAYRFVFFTVDSNILAGLSALILLPLKFRRLKTGKPLPRAAITLSLISVSAVTVTFLTVLLFLGPVFGFGSMYTGNNLWLHMVCPLLCIASYVFDSESEGRVNVPYTLLSVLPTVVYGAVYFIMVIIVGQENGGWADFYGFNMGGKWYISMAAMLAAAYLIGLGLWAAERLCSKKK